MSKTTDEIILKLLNRIAVEEEARACAISDFEYAEMALCKAHKEIDCLKEELESLRGGNVKLDNETLHMLKMYITNAVIFTDTNVTNTLKQLNDCGFLNRKAIIDKIYEYEV